VREKSNAIQWAPWVVPNGGIDESKSEHELAPNKWASGLDVEPFPEGVRRRKGYQAAGGTVPFATIDLDSGTEDIAIGDGTTSYVSQSFAVGASPLPLHGIAVRIKISAEHVNGSLQLALYTDNAGEPDVPVAGCDFSDFIGINRASVDTEYRWLTFHPLNTVTLGSGETPHIVIRCIDNTLGEYRIQYDSAGDYGFGSMATSADALAWTVDALADVNFRLYTAPGEAVNGLFEYKLSDGQSERLLVVSGGEIWDEGGSSLSTRLRVRLEYGDAFYVATSVADDIAFISDGENTPIKFHMDDGTDYVGNDGIAPPTAVPVAVVAAGGSLALGDWEVDYYYWNDRLQTKSNTKYQGGTGVAVTTAGGNRTINISGLPAAAAREGDDVTHIRISLKAPSSGLYRFAGVAQGQVAIGTTTASISVDAMTNEPEYDDDVAPVHAIACAGANQRFVVPVDQPWLVRASKLSGIGSFVESFPTWNTRAFAKGEGDYITALAFISPATLVVGCKNSVWALDARSFLTAEPVLISKNVGIAGKNSYMVIGRTLYFVSDSDRTKGLMTWDGASVRPLVAIDKTFKLLSAAKHKAASCALLAPGDTRFQWWIALSTTNSAAHDRMIVYDFALEAFTVYRMPSHIIASVSAGGAVSGVKIGSVDGILYDADTGLTDNGAAINGELTMRRNDFEQPDAAKRVRWIRAEGRGAPDGNVAVRFQEDLYDYDSFGCVLDFAAADTTPLWLGSTWGGSTWGGTAVSPVSTASSLCGLSRAVQPKFYNAGYWTLRAFSLGVQVTGRNS